MLKVRLIDIHTEPEFRVPFPCAWATMNDGELRLVMHRSQLKELAEAIEAEIADLPEDEEEAA